MKKWSMALVLLFCGMCLFAQSLFDLVKTGTPEQVQATIRASAKLDDRDEHGKTPLMYAAWFNENPEVITTLLNAGAKLDDRDEDGMTTLMYAAEFNENPDVITILLNAGADARAKSIEGKTAFDYVQNNHKIKGTKAYWELNNALFR